MGPFSKKLTPSQEAELQEFARTLREVHQGWEQALLTMHSETKALYYICCQALEENRELKAREYLLDVAGDSRHVHYEPRMQEETVDTSTLIEKAKGAIQMYAAFLADMQAKVLSLKPANWYPKKYRKAYDSWDAYFKLMMSHLEAAAGALRPPEPLKHDPRRGSKLNIFARALNSIAMFSRESRIPTDFGLRLEIERLKIP